MRALKRLLTLWADATLAAGAGALWAASRARPLPRGEEIPEPPARIVTMSGHGEMFVREAQGLQPGEPTVLLLHGWMFPANLHWVTSYRPCRRSPTSWPPITEGTVAAPGCRNHFV